MRFVKPSNYFSNWVDAYEGIVEMWTSPSYWGVSPFATIVTTIIMVPTCIVLCTLGLCPGDDDE